MTPNGYLKDSLPLHEEVIPDNMADFEMKATQPEFHNDDKMQTVDAENDDDYIDEIYEI
ncbi:hypothetical protein HDU80_007344, partial [Chytriomyces hyalinus]